MDREAYREMAQPGAQGGVTAPDAMDRLADILERLVLVLAPSGNHRSEIKGIQMVFR